MKQPEPRVTKALANAVRQYPEILEWIGEWKSKELEILPFATATPALSQGRCQVLSELYKFAKESPEIVKAKSL
jgi:hypothetical protein